MEDKEKQIKWKISMNLKKCESKIGIGTSC